MANVNLLFFFLASQGTADAALAINEQQLSTKAASIWVVNSLLHSQDKSEYENMSSIGKKYEYKIWIFIQNFIELSIDFWLTLDY